MVASGDNGRRPRTTHEKAAAMTLYPCSACGAEYTSILAADACEDDDRENRFDR